MRINSYNEAVNYMVLENCWIDDSRVKFSSEGINSNNRSSYIRFLFRIYVEKLKDFKNIRAYKPSPFELLARLICLLYVLKQIAYEKLLLSKKNHDIQPERLTGRLLDVLKQYAEIREEDIDYLELYRKIIFCVNEHKEIFKRDKGCVTAFMENIQVNLSRELKGLIEEMKSEWRLKESHPITLWCMTSMSKPIKYFRDVESPDIYIVDGLKKIVRSLTLLHTLLSAEIVLDKPPSTKTLKQTKACALQEVSSYLSGVIESPPEQKKLCIDLERMLNHFDEKYLGWREGAVSHRVNTIVQMLLSIARDQHHVSYEPMRDGAGYSVEAFRGHLNPI